MRHPGNILNIINAGLAGAGLKKVFNILPCQRVVGVKCPLNRTGQAARSGIVIDQGEAPKVFVTANLPSLILGLIVENLADLLTICQQAAGKYADAEICLAQVNPLGAFGTGRIDFLNKSASQHFLFGDI